MAYADGAIDVNAPADSDDLSNGDDEIRKFKRQVRDRLATLVVDPDADPLALKPTGVTGAITGLKRIITASAFLNDLHAKENVLDNGNGQITGFVGNDMFADLGPFIPNGCTIKLLEWIIDKDSASSVDASLRRKQFANGNPAESTLSTSNISVAGTDIVASSALAHVVDENYGYYLRLHGNGSSGQSYRVYGCRVTFDRPDLDHAT